MRIKIGNKIRFCTNVTHSYGSSLLILTTNNGVYTVDVFSERRAKSIFDCLLKEGYYDISDYDYSN